MFFMITLCHVDDINEQQSKSLTHGDSQLFAIKKDTQVYLYQNHCPHLGVQLNWQEDQFLDIDGALIQCATHGALFLIEDGECVAGPCLGQALRPVPFQIINGQLCIGPSALQID